MSDGSQVSPEQAAPAQSQGEMDKAIENPHERFKETVEISKGVLNGLADFAVKGGIDPSELTHIPTVFDPNGHILLPPVEIMRKEIIKAHGDSDTARRTRALMIRSTGQVFVPEEQAGSVHDIVHESIHRAEWLRNQETGGHATTGGLMLRQLADRMRVTITPKGTVDVHSEYIQEYADTDEERANLVKFFTESLREQRHQVGEGLTEWTTQKAATLNLVPAETRFKEEDNSYTDEVAQIQELKFKMIASGAEENQADAQLIAAALSGDISKLVNYL